MSGHLGDLSPEQEAVLDAFKEAVAGIQDKPEDNDHYYLRWLRARKFDLHKSLDMFRNHMEARKEYGVDTILDDWTPPEVFKFNPGGFFGEDRDGHPVWYDRLGKMDLRGFYRSIRREDVVKAKFAQLERRAKLCKEFSERKGKRIDTVTVVLDLDGMTLHKTMYWPGLALVKEVVRMSEAHSPETNKRSIVINAPAIFPILYNVVKPWLDETTKKKIKVLGSHWCEELQQYIAPDQLPQIYGGTRCEPDPECSDHIKPGGDIPPSYYLTNCTVNSKDDMDAVLVTRGRSHVVELEVTTASSMLKWEFLTENHDIAFGVRLGEEEVIRTERKECHIFPESGAHVCERTGTYSIVFDNSFSWARSKQVYYSVEVVPSGQCASSS